MRECAIVCCLICALQCKIAVQWIHFEARSLCDAYNMKCVCYTKVGLCKVCVTLCALYTAFLFFGVYAGEFVFHGLSVFYIAWVVNFLFYIVRMQKVCLACFL